MATTQIPPEKPAASNRSEERLEAVGAGDATAARNGPQEYQHAGIDPSVEKRLLWKMDRVVVLLVFLSCAYIEQDLLLRRLLTRTPQTFWHS
jgi:hypothetical protein